MYCVTKWTGKSIVSHDDENGFMLRMKNEVNDQQSWNEN